MASAIATIARLSDGRFRACFGTGASARRTMGQRPLTLRYLKSYVTAVRALLAGETTVVDGQPVRMLHADDLAAPRPLGVEIWLSVFGPRGIELAEQIADGIIVGMPMDHPLPIAMLMPGTVLQPGEDRGSERVREAAGPWQAVRYHETYAIAGADAVDAMPGGRAWRDGTRGSRPRGRTTFVHPSGPRHPSDRARPPITRPRRRWPCDNCGGRRNSLAHSRFGARGRRRSHLYAERQRHRARTGDLLRRRRQIGTQMLHHAGVKVPH